MTPIYHIKRMLPVLIEGLVVGSIFTGCIVIMWGAMQLFVEWMQ
jgi:hypothetical protein